MSASICAGAPLFMRPCELLCIGRHHEKYHGAANPGCNCTCGSCSSTNEETKRRLETAAAKPGLPDQSRHGVFFEAEVKRVVSELDGYGLCFAAVCDDGDERP